MKAGKKAGHFGFWKTRLVTRWICLRISFLHNLHFCSATLLIFCKANEFNARFAFPQWPEWESTSHLTQARTWCADHLFFFINTCAHVPSQRAPSVSSCVAAKGDDPVTGASLPTCREPSLSALKEGRRETKLEVAVIHAYRAAVNSTFI